MKIFKLVQAGLTLFERLMKTKNTRQFLHFVFNAAF